MSDIKQTEKLDKMHNHTYKRILTDNQIHLTNAAFVAVTAVLALVAFGFHYILS